MLSYWLKLLFNFSTVSLFIWFPKLKLHSDNLKAFLASIYNCSIETRTEKAFEYTVRKSNFFPYIWLEALRVEYLQINIEKNNHEIHKNGDKISKLKKQRDEKIMWLFVIFFSLTMLQLNTLWNISVLVL